MRSRTKIAIRLLWKRNQPLEPFNPPRGFIPSFLMGSSDRKFGCYRSGFDGTCRHKARRGRRPLAVPMQRPRHRQLLPHALRLSRARRARERAPLKRGRGQKQKLKRGPEKGPSSGLNLSDENNLAPFSGLNRLSDTKKKEEGWHGIGCASTHDYVRCISDDHNTPVHIGCSLATPSYYARALALQNVSCKKRKNIHSLTKQMWVLCGPPNNFRLLPKVLREHPRPKTTTWTSRKIQ